MKIAAATITADKLASTVSSLWRSSDVKDTYSADFRSYTGLSTKTYGWTLFSNLYNPSQWKPLVEFAFYSSRDSSSDEQIMVELHRADNSSFSGYSVIARRYFVTQAHTRCVIKKVDSGAIAGNNFYRIVVTIQGTGGAYLSNAHEVTIFPVKYY